MVWGLFFTGGTFLLLFLVLQLIRKGVEQVLTVISEMMWLIFGSICIESLVTSEVWFC